MLKSTPNTTLNTTNTAVLTHLSHQSLRGGSDCWEVLCNIPHPGLLQEVQEEEGERKPDGRGRQHQPICGTGLYDWLAGCLTD